MTEKEDKELADSVLKVSISANREIVDELIEDESMYEALMGKSLERGILRMEVNGDVYTSTVGFYYRLHQEVLP